MRNDCGTIYEKQHSVCTGGVQSDAVAEGSFVRYLL